MHRLIASLAAAVLFASCTVVVSNAQQGGASQAGVIPLDLSQRPTAMLAYGANAPVKVIFDTGAGGTVLTTATARAWNLPEQGRAMVGSPAGGGRTEGIITSLDSARLGGAGFSNARVVAADLPLPLADIAGVVSPNVFSGSLVRFEFAQSRARVVAKNAENTPSAEAYPYDNGPRPLPSMPVDVAGQSFTVHLDTGNPRGLLLPLAAAQSLPLTGQLEPAPPLRSAGGEIGAFRGRLNGTLRVGPVTVQNPEITFADGAPANVGMEILRQTTIVLDPAERRTWVLPAR